MRDGERVLGLSIKHNGRDLLTPHNRHANAYTGTLSDTPGLGVPRTVSRELQISRFVVDSDRSRKMLVLVFWSLILTDAPVMHPAAG